MSQVRKVGRPRVYTGARRYFIAESIRKFGLTGTQRRLAARKNPLVVSMTLLQSIAKEEGITLQRGRPKTAA